MPKKKRFLKDIARERGVTEKKLVYDALLEGGNANRAAELLGVPRTSITNAMAKYGMMVNVTTVIRVLDGQPS